MTDEQIEQLIERAAEEGAVELDWSWREIQSLEYFSLETFPPVLFALPNLRELDLTSNSVSDLPTDAGQLAALRIRGTHRWSKLRCSQAARA